MTGADDVVALTRYRGLYHWYVCSRAYWYLDRRPRIGGVTLRNMGEAFSEQNADAFLAEVGPFRVQVQELRERIGSRGATSIDDLADLWPVVFVDFDTRVFHVLEYEPWGLAERAPDGWRVDEEDLLSAVPPQYAFWIIDGEDVFRKLGAAGTTRNE